MATEALIERLRRATSPCLRRQLAAVGVEPGRLRAADLERLPVVTRRDLDLEALEDPVGELRLTDAPSPVRLGTSAAGGATVVLSWTARDLARIARRGAAMLRRAGIEPGMRVANTLEGGFTTPGSLVLGDALEVLGALDVPLGPVRDGRAAGSARDLLDRVGVDVVVLDADTGAGLLASIAEDPATVTRIVWCGDDEPPAGLAPRTARWLSVPEVSIFAATECGRGVLHLDPGLRAEVVEGRLVLGMPEGDGPLFRFDSGLSFGGVGGGCPCGDDGPTLREDEGDARI